MRRQSLIVLIILTLLAAGVLLWPTPRVVEPPGFAEVPGVPPSASPAFDQDAWAEQTNAWLEEVRAGQDAARQARTPEVEARETASWDRAMAMAQSVIADIRFYGRVLDQHGTPVAGVEVEYHASGTYLARGTGTGRVHTDNDGRFSIVAAKGTGLSISPLRKPGYEFRYPDGKGQNFVNQAGDIRGSELWHDTSNANPYTYRLWKVESTDQVIRGEALPGMIPDGRPYTLNLLVSANRLPGGAEGLKTVGVTDGDIIASFDVTGDEWRVTLRAIDGGLVENSDVYGNLAPEGGYRESLTFGATRSFSANRAEGLEMTRRVYFSSRGGRVFGHMNLDFDPYYDNRMAAIRLSYTTNPNGGRRLDGPAR
jgi:hypothetical protein